MTPTAVSNTSSTRHTPSSLTAAAGSRLAKLGSVLKSSAALSAALGGNDSSVVEGQKMPEISELQLSK